jgi:hypothetical protein
MADREGDPEGGVGQRVGVGTEGTGSPPRRANAPSRRSVARATGPVHAPSARAGRLALSRVRTSAAQSRSRPSNMPRWVTARLQQATTRIRPFPDAAQRKTVCRTVSSTAARGRRTAASQERAAARLVKPHQPRGVHFRCRRYPRRSSVRCLLGPSAGTMGCMAARLQNSRTDGPDTGSAQRQSSRRSTPGRHDGFRTTTARGRTDDDWSPER